MLIVTRDFFSSGELFIDHSTPDVNDAVQGISDELESDIEQYEREALVNTLGYPLFKLFSSQLDITQDNGLILGADAKWDELLNGLEYIFDGKTVNWRGLRFHDEVGVLFKDSKRKQSLLAYFIYYFYVQKENVKLTASGAHKIKSANSENTDIVDKAVRAWREFYRLTVGSFGEVRTLVNRSGMFGIDYFGSNSVDRSLFQFLADQSILDETKYPDWEPNFNSDFFINQNRFGV